MKSTVPHLTRVILLFVVSFLLISCYGSPGSTLLKYYWAGTPLAFSDSNPSTPYTIHNNTYFYTDTGTFYLQYEAWDTSLWAAYYIITSNEGSLFADGNPSYFELDLFSTGPEFYKWSYARSLENSRVITTTTIKKGSLTELPTAPANATTTAIQSGHYTLTLKSWKMR